MAGRMSAAAILSAPAAAPVASKSLAEAQQRARYFFREVRARRAAATRAGAPRGVLLAHSCLSAGLAAGGEGMRLRALRRMRRWPCPLRNTWRGAAPPWVGAWRPRQRWRARYARARVCHAPRRGAPRRLQRAGAATLHARCTVFCN
jgi:hypothetical protein